MLSAGFSIRTAPYLLDTARLLFVFPLLTYGRLLGNYMGLDIRSPVHSVLRAVLLWTVTEYIAGSAMRRLVVKEVSDRSTP
jgi:hypothetical protein